MMTREPRRIPARRPAGDRRVRRQTRSTPAPRSVELALDERAAPPRRGMAMPPADAELRQALRAATLAATQAAAQAQSAAVLLEGVLTMMTRPTPTADGADGARTAARRQTTALSPREREVLALVAEGRSNKAIAVALFVSPNTVKTHVASLLTKLEAQTRAQLAAIAAGDARHGPC